MEFTNKKTDNCFTECYTFEYRLPLTGADFRGYLVEFEVRINDTFRRPLFMAENDSGIHIKGILKEQIIRVSFPQDSWEQDKAAFDRWLESLPAPQAHAEE